MVSEIDLEVEESPVRTSGRVRVNEESLKELGLQEGSLVVVSAPAKDILVNIYCDDLIEKDKIKIRVEDRSKLSVEEGDLVHIRKHEGLLNKLL